MSKIKKTGLGFMIAIFAFFSMFGSLFFSIRPAQAQLPVTITTSLPDTVKDLKDILMSFLKGALLNAVIQAVSYATDKIAYEGAVWMASGGKGQSPMAHTESFGDFMANVGDEAFGVALEELGEPYGLNLCEVPDPQIDLTLRLGIGLNARAGTAQAQQIPNCSWSQFRENWSSAIDTWRSQYGSQDALLNQLNDSISVDQSDVGIYLGALARINDRVVAEREGEAAQRTEDSGFKAQVKQISDTILTPGNMIMAEAQANLPSAQQDKSAENFDAQLAAAGDNAFMIIPTMLATFLNTLTSQMITNYTEKGMFPFGIGTEEGGGSDVASEYGSISSVSGRRAAEKIFSDLLTTKVSAVERYNILPELTNCPDTPGIYNCVADESLAQAAQESTTGKPITIKEAIEKDWLHGNWKLISPNREADNINKTCYQSSYCYANIKVLRQLRLLPLGFEIAALNSDPDNPWTLKQVVDGFSDCSYIKDSQGNIAGINNDPVNKPFCHLIDPNWVIKISPVRCNAMVYGSTPMADGLSIRKEECVDMPSCVGFNTDGSCYAYGYCAREKNVWRFDADKCEPEYASCRVFKDEGGNQLAYLYRTLDTSYCSQDTENCAAYSLYKKNGKWAEPDSNFINQQIHFNKKVSASCSSGSAGCSAFKIASADSSLYLKKAPDYLKCYDADTATEKIDWPQTQADLTKMKLSEECGEYAKACIKDELGCNWYTSVLNPSLKIPGKFTPAAVEENQIVWNDQCDAKCSGYAAYREMPSNYSNGLNTAYIVPSTGQSCSSEEEGCAAFTNLETTESGLEKSEYYSYLRPCIKPDANKQQTFYTYEGSVVGGYQLKVFILEKDEQGGPKYFYRAADDINLYTTMCSEDLYKKGLASLDCRQFNDAQGNVFYKLLSKTIAVSEKCVSYRLNSTELYAVAAADATACSNMNGVWRNNECKVCFQNGEYRDEFCFYSGLPQGVANNAGESKGCSSAVDTCRAYKGNAGNNIKLIYENDFEITGEAVNNWSAKTGQISLSPEATRVGGHSLSYVNQNADSVSLNNLSLKAGKSYDLTFWAKAGAGKITVSLNSGVFGVVTPGDTWQYYHLGPVELTGADSGANLSFALEKGGRIYLDNLRLTEITDYIYLVKKSLVVDPVCDSDADDGLPGEALGCSEYKTADNNSIFLTNFSYLCREDAIGCVGLVDTYNTPSDAKPRAYNVWLAGESGSTPEITIGGKIFSCHISVGENGCYTNIFGYIKEQIETAGGLFNASSVYISADTSVNSPIYLVAIKEATCNQADLGCSKAGLKKSTQAGYQYEDVLIKNDPATYEQTLCQSEAVGCRAYSSAQGTYYFKAPEMTGQKVCSYKKDVTVNGVKTSGWFWKNTGICSNNSTRYCSENGDCATGGTCQGIGDQPCYPNYLLAGGNYGIWSFGDKAEYKNFVGECSIEADGCSKFVDHSDNDTAYYFLENNKFKNKQSECRGEASQSYGCILLDKTDSPNKSWSTAATYLASARKSYDLVAPESNENNDANVIIKVTKDRECGEWLYCNQVRPVKNPETGEVANKCYGLGVCEKSQPGEGSSQCAKDITSNWEGKNQILTENVYRGRDVSWRGMDYSGYSLFNQFQPADLNTVVYSEGGKEYSILAIYKNETCSGADDGKNCGKDNNGDGNKDGICSKKMCYYPVSGITPGGAQGLVKDKLVETSVCRGYPEKDSPYPSSILSSDGRFKTGFDKVNLCNGGDCDCSYLKKSYGSNDEKSMYYESADLAGDRVCSGGKYNDVFCSEDGTTTAEEGYVTKENCQNEGGSCLSAHRQSYLTGWQGYCLERDMRRKINGDPKQNSCLTWLPLDAGSGIKDIFYENTSAGYLANNNQDRYVCLYNESPLDKNYSKVFVDMNGSSEGGMVNAFVDVGSNYNQYGDLLDEDNYVRGVDPKLQIIMDSGKFGVNFTSLAKAVINKSYIMSDENLRSNENSRLYREWFIPLGRDYVIPGNNGNEDFIKKEEIKRIDVYFDGEDQLTSITPNIVSFETDGVNLVNSTIWKGKEYGKFNSGMIDNGKYEYWEWQGFVENTECSINNISDPIFNLFPNLYKQPKWNTQGATANQGLLDLSNGDGGMYYNGADSEGSCSGLGIRAVFDKDNYFKGFWMFMHHNAEGAGHEGFFFVIHFTNGRCKVMAQVSQKSNSAFSLDTKPITWQMRLDELKINPVKIQEEKFRVNRKKNFNFIEYGLTSSLVNLPKNLTVPIWVDPFNPNEAALDLSQKPAGVYKGGIPMAVFTNSNAAPSTLDTAGNCGGDDTHPVGCLLEEMFAKIYKIWTWNSSEKKYDENLNSVNDAAALRRNSIPQIAAPDFSSCINKSAGSGCRIAKKSAFAVNDKYNEDVYLSSGNSAFVRFYAWADPMQMPLRRIKIDFDNGSFPFQSQNDAQSNYKPRCDAPNGKFCSADNKIPCATNAECINLSTPARGCSSEDATHPQSNFGNTTETGCVPDYFEVSTNYVCDLEGYANIDDVPAAKRYGSPEGGHIAVMKTTVSENYQIALTPKARALGLSDGSLVCAFKPKVQVMDNWGWCSGNCGGAEGCYKEFIDS
ncbi:MAG: hypothetical protein PHY40_03480, partial [Patescibacteria group bacterium]|nr:hypothetical protein [Patescibacteria group bacterium]